MFHDSCLSLNQVITVPYRPETDAAGETTRINPFRWSEKVGDQRTYLVILFLVN
ncbi:hypothetical protein [Xenorhabdus bovienii]|uniref:Uncharacterized protein n=2 Tax=Xenorhabdus bovienii TaxID=40576 RepID=A0A077N8J8_XENBV|nr:hypothetical protein [Xenorhabdus bovienii]CDG98526.1 hypothetical protein XBP1_330034 [Xenorhabdus bovienii str. puntauvense]CDH01312.1 hypothetical protein XBFM1_2050080 [Xenorhabdus bovienii str. feltiae Moldova]